MFYVAIHQGRLPDVRVSGTGQDIALAEARPEAIACGLERVRQGPVEPDVLAVAIMDTLSCWSRHLASAPGWVGSHRE